MHVLLAITSYQRDRDEIKTYLEMLPQVEYLREIKFYDVVCTKENSDFIADLFYPAGGFQKLYSHLPAIIKALIGKAGVQIHKPQPQKIRPPFLVRSKVAIVLKSEDEVLEGVEQI